MKTPTSQFIKLGEWNTTHLSDVRLSVFTANLYFLFPANFEHLSEAWDYGVGSAVPPLLIRLSAFSFP